MNQNIGIILLIIVILCVVFYSRKESFGSTGGALMQLVAKDPQDSYLIGGPRPYAPWSYNYYYYPFFSHYPYGFDL